MNTKESCSYASMSMPNTGCFCSNISLLSLKKRLRLSSLYLLHAILHSPISSSLTSTKSEIRKATPQSPYWLSTAQWQNLNTFISGQLLVPLPPAAVCDVFPRIRQRILILASTGGGHSIISSHYSLAANTSLKLELVTPAGDIVTSNRCTNTMLLLLAYSVPRFRPVKKFSCHVQACGTRSHPLDFC